MAGLLGGPPFYLSCQRFEYWQQPHLIIEDVPGRGSGFYADAPEGVVIFRVSL